MKIEIRVQFVLHDLGPYETSAIIYKDDLHFLVSYGSGHTVEIKL